MSLADGPDPAGLPGPATAAANGGALARTALARFATTTVAVTFMFATSVIVARSLGPDGKGVVATVSFLIALLGTVALAGFDDAAVVLAGKGRYTLQRAARASTAVVLVGAVVAAGLLFPVAGLLSLHSQLAAATAVAAAAVVMTAGKQLFMRLAEGAGRVVFSGVGHALMAVATAISTYLLVTVARLDVAGAVWALAVGPALGAALLAAGLRRDGVVVLPRWDREFTRSARPLALPIGLTQLVRLLAARLDVVIVYGLVGAAVAGQYSVAVTVGGVIGYAPGAIAAVAFPVAAAKDPAALPDFVGQVVRITAAASLVVAVGLAVLVPFAVPAVFGPGFAPAVLPALVMLAEGIAASLRWVVSRGLAAAEDSRSVAAAFLLSAVVMVVLDAVLVPGFGALGAAVAATIASWAGTVLAVARLRRVLSVSLPVSALVPRGTDVRQLLHAVAMLLARLRRRP